MQEASDPDRGNFRTSESDFSTVPCVVLAVADIAYYAQIMRVIFKTLRWILHVITYSIKLFMPLLPILRYPDPRLKKVAKRVEKFDDSIRRLAADMAETMYEAPGIGLAATQVDVHLRVIVIDVSETRDQLLVLVNPELVESDGLQVC